MDAFCSQIKRILNCIKNTFPRIQLHKPSHYLFTYTTKEQLEKRKVNEIWFILPVNTVFYTTEHCWCKLLDKLCRTNKAGWTSDRTWSTHFVLAAGTVPILNAYPFVRSPIQFVYSINVRYHTISKLTTVTETNPLHQVAYFMRKIK